jgi:hypothetical protein
MIYCKWSDGTTTTHTGIHGVTRIINGRIERPLEAYAPEGSSKSQKLEVDSYNSFCKKKNQQNHTNATTTLTTTVTQADKTITHSVSCSGFDSDKTALNLIMGLMGCVD